MRYKDVLHGKPLFQQIRSADIPVEEPLRQRFLFLSMTASGCREFRWSVQDKMSITDFQSSNGSLTGR